MFSSIVKLMYKIFQLPFQTQAQQEKKRNFADHENLNPGVVGGGVAECRGAYAYDFNCSIALLISLLSLQFLHASKKGGMQLNDNSILPL